MSETEVKSQGISQHEVLDPELIKLPRPKSRIRPITALAVFVICVTLCVRLYRDLRFSLQETQLTRILTPEEISPDLLNHYVQVQTIPNRPQALRMLSTNSLIGPLLLPTLNSKGKLWLLLHASPWNEPMRTDEVYQGRVSRLSDLRYDKPLQEYYAKGAMVPVPIPLASIRTLLHSKATQLQFNGETIAISDDLSLQITESNTNQIRLNAVSTDPYRDEASWSLALTNAGVMPSGQKAISSKPQEWTFDVPAQNGIEQIKQKLEHAKLYAVTASEISVVREGVWSDLSLDEQDILLGKARTDFIVTQVSLRIPPTVDPNAFVLITTESPGDFWYVPILFGVIALLGLLFAFGFYRRVRGN